MDWLTVADHFEDWANSFNAKVSSKKKALKLLKQEGILTSSGNLTKRYS